MDKNVDIFLATNIQPILVDDILDPEMNWGKLFLPNEGNLDVSPVNTWSVRSLSEGENHQ